MTICHPNTLLTSTHGHESRMRKDDFIMKKKIFICSPYRGRVEENKKNAVSYARIAAMSGDVPIVPHLYFPSFLDDNIPNERMTGIAMGLELMDM